MGSRQRKMGSSARLFLAAAIAVLAMAGFLVGRARGFSLCNHLLGAQGPWINAHATFYDDGGRGGACGYGSLGSQLFSNRFAAGSPAVYLGGLTCGMCVEVKCVESPACKAGSVRLTITDLCPPGAPNTQWCGGGKRHLDLAKGAFPVIANPGAGHVPIQFRTVPCAPYNVLTLNLRGHQWWLEVTAVGIPGSGRILRVEVAGNGSPWTVMKRAYGAAWATAGSTLRSPISVRVSIFGNLCKLTARDCIKGPIYNGRKVTCGYSVGY
ncbi:hypothetical protein CBR_g47958 [Chara braunii]|uniref:Expansin n=1 Tax=Chara braunii TaxID=69332 RepID=A0A388M1M4_CHABU|nr:hypothetical protein CBR_g47958 [Chara braunii]|eukprot:GBG88488.1 hypothetical protein CBR_g47958 [Chara braunii]